MKYVSAIDGIPRKILRAFQLVFSHLGWKSMDERLGGFIRLGYWPHLKHPRSFNEKIAHRKIYDRNPLFNVIADKVQVRDFVEKKLGPGFVVPVIGIYDDPDLIPWDRLPESFVVKTNHRSGGNLIVPEKSKLDLLAAQKTLRKWFDEPYGQEKFEWFYEGFPRKILVEEFLKDPVNIVPADYKIYTFHGRVEFIHVDHGRFGEHQRSFYDRDWNRQVFSIRVPASGECEKPRELLEMIRVAETLAQGIDFVRVDLYLVEGKIYVGEMTLTPSSGRKAFYPDKSYDFFLGSFW